MTGKEFALLCAQTAEDMKAKDIVIMHITNLFGGIADYFVVCSGTSERHVASIFAELQSVAKKNKIQCIGKEGFREGKWILIDYDDVVIHIYLEEIREYYELEDLWGDAPRLSLEELQESPVVNAEKA